MTSGTAPIPARVCRFLSCAPSMHLVSNLSKRLFCFFALLGFAITGRSQAGFGVSGQAWHGAMGVRQTTARIVTKDKEQVGKPKVLHVAPRHVLRPQSTGSTNQASFQQPNYQTAGVSPQPFVAQTVSPTINFTAATFNDCSGWPPDTMGAVGPTQFIIALNGRVRSFDKTTGSKDSAIDATTDTFFSSVMTPGSNFTTDPRIRYDRLSGRWFITMIDVPGQKGTLPNRVMVAMSDSGIITTSTVWTFFQFQQDQVGTTPNLDTGDFAD